MGPSNGMPDSIRAAEAALIASTSWGFSRSAPMMVPTTWVSLRKPLGNDGRSGRSMRRQVRMAWSVGRPSRRKNEPGIFPAAYIRSSMSTVSGKKSMPSRTSSAALAVTRMRVFPMRPTTAPWDCGANRPVSKDRVRSVPEMGADTEMASAMGHTPSAAGVAAVGRRRGQFPVGKLSGECPGPSRLAADSWRRGFLQNCYEHAKSGHEGRSLGVLPAQTEPGNQFSVMLDIIIPDVIEEPATATDQLHEPAPGVMIPLVHPEVLGEVRDALRKDGDLDLGGPGVGVMLPIGDNRGGFVRHTASL